MTTKADTPDYYPASADWQVGWLGRGTIVLLFVLMLLACTESERRDPQIEIEIRQHSEQEAIQVVQSYVRRQGGRVTIAAPYWENTQRIVSCSQVDVDTDPLKDDPLRRKCKNPDLHPSYGRKSVREQVRKCCKPKTVEMPATARWAATYSREQDGWRVDVSFEVDRLRQVLQWDMADKTGAVSQRALDQ